MEKIDTRKWRVRTDAVLAILSVTPASDPNLLALTGSPQLGKAAHPIFSHNYPQTITKVRSGGNNMWSA